jgi:hypothetical protein
MAVRTRSPRPIRVATAVAAIFTLLVLAMTIPAAPIMFQIGSAPPNPRLIAELADRFTVWTNLRAVAADIAAVALLYALTECALHPTASSDFGFRQP